MVYYTLMVGVLLYSCSLYSMEGPPSEPAQPAQLSASSQSPQLPKQTKYSPHFARVIAVSKTTKLGYEEQTEYNFNTSPLTKTAKAHTLYEAWKRKKTGESK